jgi:hypothetical protein
MAELCLCLVEQVPHLCRVADVGANRDSRATGLTDDPDLCLGFLWTAGIVDDDIEAVAGQAPGNCGSNATRGARHDCPLSVLSRHLIPL